jgi:RNA polymerase sigma-70 factor (ECF subfamily)
LLTNDTPYHDSDLLLKLAEGDENAFAALYGRYKSALTAFIVTFVKSPEMAEDLSQEVFIKIWELRHQLSQVISFRAYLFTAARNHTLNILKKAAHEEMARAEIIRHIQQLRSEVEEELLSKEYEEHLSRILQELPAQSRRVFHLCREQYKSYSEVASMLGISRNAVKKHMVRSMKTLRESLGPEFTISLPFLIFFHFSFLI